MVCMAQLTTTELQAAVLAFVSSLTPELLTGEQAAIVVTDLALIEKAAATVRMFAALRVAQTNAWKGSGHASAADWLAAQCGISVTKAAAQLRTAKTATKLPKTKKAMDRGELSPDQADSVAGAAAVDPDAEEELLDSAGKDTTSELRRKADARKAAATDTAARERRIRKERSLRFRNDQDGAFCLNLRGPAIDGARLLAMLKPYQQVAFNLANKNLINGARDTYDNRNYDAFCAMLAHLTQTNTASGSGSGSSRDTGTTNGSTGNGTTRNSKGTGGAATGSSSTRGSRGQTPQSSQPQSGRSQSGSSQNKSSATATTGPRRSQTETSPPGSSQDGRPQNGRSRGGANSALLRARADAKARAAAAAARARANTTKTSQTPSAAPNADERTGTGAESDYGVTPDPVPSEPDGQDLLPKGWPNANEFKPPGGNNTKIIIRIDHTALVRGHCETGETCEIDGVGPIPVSAVKDLILHDDPFIAAITTNGTDIQKVVHLGRGLNTHQRTAIEAMGLRCSNIACNQTIALQIDHRDPWTTNNQTVLDNQDPLCPECHNHKTHHGWNLEPGKGPRKFLPPETANQTSGNDPVPTSTEVPVGTTTDDQLQFC